MNFIPQVYMQLWLDMDLILKTVAVLLLLMSLISWTVIVIKLSQNLRLRKALPKALKALRQSNSLTTFYQSYPKPHPSIKELISQGMAAIQEHQLKFKHQVSLIEWLNASLKSGLAESIEKIQQGLSTLATIAALAPFIGLFGTVYGIYKALMQISISKASSIDQISGPVGEALIMTAAGLAVAIPAAFFFNLYTRANKKTVRQIKHFLQLIYPYLLPADNTNNFNTRGSSK